MQCYDFREIACLFLDDELLVETNHEVIRHLEACAECRRELAARRDIRVKLRAAVLSAPKLQMSEAFIARLRLELQTRTQRRKFFGGFLRNR